MTRYEDLCEVYFAREPYQLAIDAIFREIPEKLRQALSDHLQVPASAPILPSLTAGDRAAASERPIGSRGTAGSDSVLNAYTAISKPQKRQTFRDDSNPKGEVVSLLEGGRSNCNWRVAYRRSRPKG
jgi:hypothetical protein